MESKYLGIIPARGGSKGLPGKNIKELNGIPLIGYSIRAALESHSVSRTIVSTDDEAIADIAIKFGSEVLMRPTDLAKDDSLMADVILHCLNELQSKEGYVSEAFVLLQPTSPLRESSHIDEAFNIFENKNCDGVISVFEPKDHPLKSFKLSKNGFLEGLIDSKFCFLPRQELPTAYMANGSIFLIKTVAFLKNKRLFSPRIMPYFMTKPISIDIDEINDFDYAAFQMNKKRE
jgi:CMP-N,N'-diacetyllegionaminic acid synthase